MNKKIASEIAIGVILLLAIVVGGIFWLQNKKEVPVNQPVAIQPAQQTPVTQPTAATQLVDETMPSSPQNVFQQNGKTIRGYGIEAYFEDGVLNADDLEVVFSPKNRIMPKAGEQQPVGVPDDIYEMIVRDYRTADVIIKEASQQQLLTKKPIQKNINNFIVVEYGVGGFCDNRYAEVVGKNHNYMFTSLGCAHSEKEDFDSFEKVISTFKFTDSAADETANWQTYTNQELGFSFKYPSSWPAPVLDKNAHAGSGGYPAQDSIWTLNVGNQEKDCEGSTCYVFKFEAYKGNNLQLFSSDLKKNELVEVKSETNMNGSSAIVYSEGGICGNKNAFIFGNIISIKFSAHCGDEDTDRSKLFDQIIASFKFTDSTADETADWKTYKNDKYGFELTFPQGWNGYSVDSSSDENGDFFSFSLPFSPGINDLTMFNIVVAPISAKTIEAESDCKKGIAPATVCGLVNNQIIKNNKNIFYYERGDLIGDAEQFEAKSSSVKNRFDEIASILKTFKFTNN